jgi:hypothetical protein
MAGQMNRKGGNGLEKGQHFTLGEGLCIFRGGISDWQPCSVFSAARINSPVVHDVQLNDPVLMNLEL